MTSTKACCSSIVIHGLLNLRDTPNISKKAYRNLLTYILQSEACLLKSAKVYTNTNRANNKVFSARNTVHAYMDHGRKKLSSE